jgi:hypothetical protein
VRLRGAVQGGLSLIRRRAKLASSSSFDPNTRLGRSATNDPL